MAIKTYTINGAGQRFNYKISGDELPGVPPGEGGQPGGVLKNSDSSGRIGCYPIAWEDGNAWKKGADAVIMAYSFTVSNDAASKISLSKISWTGKLNVMENTTPDSSKSQPRCLVTTLKAEPNSGDLSKLGNYLNIWSQGAALSFLGSTASAENIPVYDNDFKPLDKLTRGQTYYILVFDNFSYPNGYGYRAFDTSSDSLVVTTEVEAYSNIGQPSEIKATASYVKPGGSLTVEWEAAKKGDDNKVTGYTIDWKIDNKAQKSLTTSDTSIDLLIPSDVVRGTSISCTITANPQREGYGSAPVTNNDVAKINRLPSAPTVTPSRTLVPSTGGSVRFDLDGSGGDLDDQKIEFRYKKKINSKDSIPINNNSLNIEVSENTTFVFWINDGLEDGPTTEIIITKNTKPTFNASISGSAIAPSIEITPNTETSSNEYTCSLVYGTTTKPIGTSKTGSFSIADIRSYGISPDTAYSFTITRNDGIETYSESRIGAGLKSPGRPNYNGYIGQVKGLEGYFDSVLSPVFSEVNDLNKVTIIINNSNFIFNLAGDSDQRYFTLSDSALNAFVRGNSTTMKIVFGKGTSFFPAYSIEEKFTRVISGADALSNLVLNGFNLFESTPVLTFRNIYSDYNAYGFANDPLSEETAYTFQVSFNGTTPLEVNFYPDSVSSDNQLSYNLSGQEIYNRLVDVLEHEKSHTVSVIVSFKNDLGGTASRTINTVVDCGIDIKLDGMLGLSAQDEEISTWNYLLQGMTIKNNSFSCTAYSKNLYAQIYVSRDNGKTWIAYNQIPGKTTDTLKYGPTPCTFNFESTELTTIGPTSIDYTPQFKIKLFTSKKIQMPEVKIYSTNTITVKALIAPTINIVSGVYEKVSEDKGKITIKYQFINNIDNKITKNSLVKLYIGTEEKEKGTWVVSADQVITQDYTFGKEADGKEIENVLIYLEGIVEASVTARGSTYSASVITETPAYMIFNIQPTVSYRKNRLGINSSIDGTENENYVIKIASSGSSSATKIALVSKTNTTRIINIEDGALINFIIDCGTWDT